MNKQDREYLESAYDTLQRQYEKLDAVPYANRTAMDQQALNFTAGQMDGISLVISALGYKFKRPFVADEPARIVRRMNRDKYYRDLH